MYDICEEERKESVDLFLNNKKTITKGNKEDLGSVRYVLPPQW